ncbi:MAG: hypothetical protein C4B58_11415 [Deltaproteobacteria bacterium]|nr:MAG: hypothetical protein C4B58_11415 [Deltaproteobacteria bacterium]
MIIRGQLIAEAPIYRGNARKTLFTRDGDGSTRMISLAGEIAGTAESLMDAFIGESRNGRNIGLLNRLWQRLYGKSMPVGLITEVDCRLKQEYYNPDKFFDLRMGIKLDKDRWAAEANANYKMETTFRNCVFDFRLMVNDKMLKSEDNQAGLYYLLKELEEGRFWFGAGKTKGLGRCRLELDASLPKPVKLPGLSPKANHISVNLRLDAENPILIGWNWGKVESDQPSFVDTNGKLFLQGMSQIPGVIRGRLEIAIGGNVSDVDKWKAKLARSLPRAITGWITQRSSRTEAAWTFPKAAVAKLSKGKHAISKKVLSRIEPLIDRKFPSREAAEDSFYDTLGKNAKKSRRILDILEHEQKVVHELDRDAWQEMAGKLGIVQDIADDLAAAMDDQSKFEKLIIKACEEDVLPGLYNQVDQQQKLLQSDVWVDEEITTRLQHIQIKNMLMNGEITERQWDDPGAVPKGVTDGIWREFLQSHNRVRYRHMVNSRNLRKSIVNDENCIAVLKAYRDHTRVELSRPENTDFRAGGPSNREISQAYGKPYDKVFMKMFTWSPSVQEKGKWEVYIPGSTIKGAFRRRASQVLTTLWGEGRETGDVLDWLFGRQRQPGRIQFSDAYLADPDDPQKVWCSMDGVRMDPATGRPIEQAKTDFLFAYGKDLSFRTRLDIDDVSEKDMPALNVFAHLLNDFQMGDIPLGGEKTSGFGWTQARLEKLTWLAPKADKMTEKLFGNVQLEKDGIWRRAEIEGPDAASIWTSFAGISKKDMDDFQEPRIASRGFISHSSFGGYSGKLMIEGTVLTPVHVRESGEPFYTAVLNGEPVNGWDFFSISPPSRDVRGDDNSYALPSKTLKGMIRHIYSIASESSSPSTDISKMNPADSLFGWVGAGQNQALMGRLVFDFGVFENIKTAWFKVPYPYGHWQWTGKEWKNVPGNQARFNIIAGLWRLFPNVPLAPSIERLDDLVPDDVQANYIRAILPGGKFHTSIRFWNLKKEELQRLIWCLEMENGMAHKVGKTRYLGFGSLTMRVLPESYLIDWNARYAGDKNGKWRKPLSADQWLNSKVIAHHSELLKALNAKSL